MKINGRDEREFIDKKFEFDGVMILYYMGKVVAAIKNTGEIIIRNEDCPIYLIEYLLENINEHQYTLN